MAEHTYLTSIDYVVFFGTIGISLLIRLFFACRYRTKRSADNYFHGDRQMSFIPTALSLVSSFQSSLLLIGVPAEVYAYGFKYTYYIIGASLGYFIVALIVVPVFHPLKLTSVYKYFGLRYHDNTLRYLMMVLGVGYYVLYMGMVTFGTCVALEVLMGIPHWGTILIYTCITSIYTSVGGMRAVIWTDVFQISVMVMGVVAIIVKSTVEVGGRAKLMELGSSRLQMNAFQLDPTIRYQFWSLLLGAFVSFFVCCSQQPGIQRINSSPSVSSARRVLSLSGSIYALLAFAVMFEGVALFAYFNHKGCDPLASGRIDGYDQIIPLAVADLFVGAPGLSGLFLAALSSAVLSILSSGINSLVAIMYDDVIREIYPHMLESKATNISKLIVFFYGLLAMGIAFGITGLQGSIMSIFSIIASSLEAPSCAVFFVSLLYKRATTKGVVIGALVGMAVTLWLNIGNMLSTTKDTPALQPASINFCPRNSTAIVVSDDLPNHGMRAALNTSLNATEHSPDTAIPDYTILQLIYSISFMYVASIGCIIAMLASIIASKLTTPLENIDVRCLFSFSRHVWQPLCGKRNKEGRSEIREHELNEF